MGTRDVCFVRVVCSLYQIFWKKDFCCFGYMTQSLSFVNWQVFVFNPKQCQYYLTLNFDLKY